MKLRVLPNSLWLAYDVLSPNRLEPLLPSHLKLANVQLYEDDAPSERRPKLLMNVYDVRSDPWMRGTRVEVQTLARDPTRGTVHLVLLEILSDALLWDPLKGVQLPNAQCSHGWKWRTRDDREYEMHVSRRGACALRVRGTRHPSRTRAPGRRFVVDANRECYFMTCERGFRMKFNESEVMTDVSELVDLEIHNDLWRAHRFDHPTHVFVHRCPMHFDVDVRSEFWYDRFEDTSSD